MASTSCKAFEQKHTPDVKNFKSKTPNEVLDEVLEHIEVGDVKGEVASTIELNSFEGFSEEFLNDIMDGRLDITYLKKKYPQMKEEDLREILVGFQDFSMSLDDPTKELAIGKDMAIVRNQPGSKELINLIQNGKEEKDGRTVSRIRCNFIDCDQEILLGDPDEHCTLEADPLIFMCPNCQVFIQEINNS